VCFSPDEKAILSTSADASATLTKFRASNLHLAWPWMLTALALFILCIAIVLGWVRRYLEGHPAQLDSVLQVVNPALDWFTSASYQATKRTL
jgi:glucan phosphoethanolaminetransferase (alkaline phosphatase superfamily)